MRGIEHVGDVRHPAAAVLEQLDDDEEELVRVDRADGEVVVAVLGVVEVEATEPADHRQPADDLLDVRVREVVAEVDETRRPLPRVLGEQQRRPPVGVDRRVERRLVGLVLGEHPPAVGQGVVDLPQAVGDPLELPAEVGLPGMVHPVGEPHRQSCRSELLAELDAVDVVLDGPLAGVG